jgi:hypothetical protein
MAYEIVIRSPCTMILSILAENDGTMLPEFKYELMLIFIVFHLITKSLFLKYI